MHYENMVRRKKVEMAGQILPSNQSSNSVVQLEWTKYCCHWSESAPLKEVLEDVSSELDKTLIEMNEFVRTGAEERSEKCMVRFGISRFYLREKRCLLQSNASEAFSAK